MVSYLQAFLLAIIQGITEWLPVSSSAHLAITQQLLGISPPVIFDILLHGGTLFAVLIYFRNDLFALFSGFLTFNPKNQQFQYCIFIVVASIPTAIIGFLFHDFFADMFSNLFFVAIALIITGIILYSTRFQNSKINEKSKLNFPIAFIIGIAQGFAVAPGISRSGVTISSGLFAGLNRETAARFSFLISIPALVGAGLVEFIGKPLTIDLLGPSLFGACVAAVIGYLSIGFLLDIIRKGHFSIFAYYCWFVALVVIILQLLS
ncbi:MAG: undecaprenyl-diphosphate phosphatase [Candidatus Micrarchaeota archaeon]